MSIRTAAALTYLVFLGVNGAPQWRRSLVEGGSTHVVVGETW